MSIQGVYLQVQLLGLTYWYFLGGTGMNWVEIGARIRSQREAFGYTRETFAEMLDVTPKFCADIELGKKDMSVPTLCRIASVLKLSTDYILFGGPIVKENLDKSLREIRLNLPSLRRLSMGCAAARLLA